MRLDLEQAFIQRYVLKSKRDRYLSFIATEKNRGKFLSMLYHGQDLDKRLFIQVGGSYQQQLDAVCTKANVVKNGGRCYVVSINRQIDGQEMDSLEAINLVVCHIEATLLLFGEMSGVYYEGEAPFNYYLSL